MPNNLKIQIHFFQPVLFDRMNEEIFIDATNAASSWLQVDLFPNVLCTGPDISIYSGKIGIGIVEII